MKIDARGKYMVVITSKSMIKLFDISRRTYKQIGVTRKFEMKSGETIGEIRDIALNADGKKLAIISDQVPFLIPSSTCMTSIWISSWSLKLAQTEFRSRFSGTKVMPGYSLLRPSTPTSTREMKKDKTLVTLSCKILRMTLRRR